MKKKISILLLIIFALPLLAFVGCGRQTYYNVTLSYSGTGHIDPPQTSFSAGSNVHFSATGNVVAWIYQGSTLLKNGSTYSIKNTTSGGNVVKSELSFKATNSTKGAYTAVFADEKMPYVKLHSWRVTTNISTPAVQESADSIIMTANFSVAQGINELDTITSVKNADVRDNVEYTFEDINKVIKLDPESYTQISANDITFTTSSQSSASFSQFRTTILLQEDTARTETTRYSQYVDYADGTYEIVFEFRIPGTTYYFVLVYNEL